MSPKRLTDKELAKNPEIQLNNFKRTKDYLIAIDTDGCITDNMNGKQMLIFHPQFMEFYNLWGIETYFREVAEYYNLYSEDRGCNRFVAISLTLKALRTREDVKSIINDKKLSLPDIDLLDRYISYAKEKNLGLGNPSLSDHISRNPTELFYYKLLGWSEAVNRTFTHISAKIPPFNGVKDKLDLMAEYADIIVVSKTPYEDLANYWENQSIDKYVQIIAGQEMGSKGHHIGVAKEAGVYKDDRTLMLGDGNGDLKAVKDNNGLFYPITPGKEQECWEGLPDALKMFTDGKYRGSYEKGLLDDFTKALPPRPPWEEAGYDHTSSYKERQNIRQDLYKRFNPEGRLAILK